MEKSPRSQWINFGVLLAVILLIVMFSSSIPDVPGLSALDHGFPSIVVWFLLMTPLYGLFGSKNGVVRTLSLVLFVVLIAGYIFIWLGGQFRGI